LAEANIAKIFDSRPGCEIDGLTGRCRIETMFRLIDLLIPTVGHS
jgi:hypothetical protein